jgi:hypothetical protein
MWGKELYFDGTKVAANAGKESLTTRFAVEAHLLNLFGEDAEQAILWKLWPRQATGNKKYDTEDNLVAIEDQGMRAYIPSPDFDHRTPFFVIELRR